MASPARRPSPFHHSVIVIFFVVLSRSHIGIHGLPVALPGAFGEDAAASLLRLPSADELRESTLPRSERNSNSPVSSTQTVRVGSAAHAQQRSPILATDVCSVRAFGGAGDGVQFDTRAIQAAIDECAPRNGVVHFSPGRYLTATVFLRSNVTVLIDRGATVLGSTNQSDYPAERERWYVMLAEDAENVTVAGGGTVHGQGLEFISQLDARKNVMVSWNATGDCRGDECRPRLIGFVNCKNVRVSNVNFMMPAYWCLNIIDSSNVLIEYVRIQGDFNSPNNDGIDIDGSNNTVIRGCHIDTGDDAICPKTNNGPLYNLTVTDCWIRTKSCAVKLGSQSSFDFHGLHFERLKIVDSHRGLGIQLRDSGDVSDVTFANIDMSTRYYDPSWWGRAEPVYVTACPRDASTAVGSVTGVRFVNISSTSPNGIFLAGAPASILTNFSFQNVSLTYVDAAADARAATRWHDYRPGCRGLVAHPSSGLFIEYASGLNFRDVVFNWAVNGSWNVPFDFTPMTVDDVRLDNFTTTSSSAVPSRLCASC